MSKADDVFWKEFGSIIGILVLFTIAMFFLARAIGANTFERVYNTPMAISERIKPFGQVRIGNPDEMVAAAPAAAMVSQASAEPRSGDAVYNSACVACHASGVAGAPKLDDKANWSTRAAQGIDGLVSSALNGKGAMPPRGGNPTITPEEIRSAIEFMLKQAGV